MSRTERTLFEPAGRVRSTARRHPLPAARDNARENAREGQDPRNLAYIIYTSGSTGVPKGAMVEQRGMLNHLLAKVRDLELTAGDRVAQTASQCFDISVWQFLAPLLVGGRVEIFPDAVAHDPAALLEGLDAGGVSIVETVPSLMRLLLEEVEGGTAPPLEALRWMIPTGEALPPELARRWLAAYPGIPLLNAYGPTECSDDVSHHALRQPPAPDVTNIPIGRPILNTRLTVLDPDFQPCPSEVPGELVVAGICVGRGYRGEPARTAVTFVPDPHAGYRGERGEPGARVYRTGDLVRTLADGTLEFLGRIDHQVKVRGNRIELGEIEAVLGKHPAVAQAVVTVRGEGGLDRLVAYLVGHPDGARKVPRKVPPTLQPADSEEDRKVPATLSEVPATLSEAQVSEVPATLSEPLENAAPVAELRAFLLEHLPDYMVPDTFVTLSAFPLTHTGKVDRKALPAPDQDLRAGGYVAPRDAVEEALVEVWQEVLGVERVGVEDPFFELGGHSLLAIRLMTRVRERFGRRLPIATLFTAGTVALLAEVLRQGAGGGRREALVPITTRREGTPQAPMFWVHPVGGNVLCYAELARTLGENQPFYGLQVPEFPEGTQRATTVEELASLYVDAIRAVEPEGPYHLAGWSMGGTVAFEMARQLRREGRQIARLLLVDTPAPGYVQQSLDPGNPVVTEATKDPDESALLALFLHDLAGMAGQKMPIGAADLRALEGEKRLPIALERARRAGLLPDGLEEGEGEEMFTIFRTNFLAMRRYDPRPYGGDLTLIRAQDTLPDAEDATLGWGEMAAGAVTVEWVPGGHYGVLGSVGEWLLGALKA